MSIQDQQNRDIVEAQKIPSTVARARVQESLLRLWALIAAGENVSLDAFKRQAQLRELELKDALEAVDVDWQELGLRVFRRLNGTYRSRLAQPRAHDIA